MNIEVSIDNNSLQEDIIEFTSWKLYSLNKFPTIRQLDYIMIKKIIDGELTIKEFSKFHEEEDDEYLKKKYKEETRKLLPEEVAFQIGTGIFSIPIADGQITIENLSSSEIYALSHNTTQHKKIIIKGPENLISIFICELDNYLKKPNKTYIKIFSPSTKGYWDELCRNPKREINTVFINRKKEVIDDLDQFINSENDYKIFGHPYKRNYLFHGPPGNGKTSFINAIASKYDLNIFMISFSSIIGDEIFKKLVSTIPKNGMLIMEDIDSLFDEKKNISMSSVLNILDGLARKTRIICIMTTNNFEKLTDVFKRPGRIDLIVEFNKADEECFTQMADFMITYHKNKGFNMDNIDELKNNAVYFYENIAHMEPSRALVQKFLFENRNINPHEIFTKKMIQKFKDLFQIYSNDKSHKINIYN